MPDPDALLDPLASDALTVHPGDLFNPPGLTNFWGQVQAARDPVAIQHLTFPPFSNGDIVLGAFTLNGVCVGKSGAPLTFRWRPDHLHREAEHDGFHVASRTVLPMTAQRAVVAVTVTNTTDAARDAEIRLRTDGGVIHSVDGWHTPYAPKEGPSISVTPWEGTPPPEQLIRNRQKILVEQGAVRYDSQTSEACALHAAHPRPDAIEQGAFVFTRSLAPGATVTVYYHVELGDDAEALLDTATAWQDDPDAVFTQAAQDWADEWTAVFTPGNDRYSGYLPRLDTENADLQRIYETAILGLVYFKREHPASAYGRTYTNLMPRYWVTTSFINDWSLSAYALALLDPDCVRRQVELWLERDIYDHFGTEYVSGENAGNWYSCNDFAMVRLISAYVRVTGDHGWLDREVAGRSIFDHVVEMAAHVSDLDAGHGLADGGDRNSLLECVGRYTHEVASVNAGYVWALREAAALCDVRDDDETAATLRQQAADLTDAIQDLYVPGEGTWQCRQPDGTLTPMHHAWDFVHTLNFLHDDLPPEQRDELVAFFEHDLMTPTWMRALAAHDADADFSLRPDHQWNGSYPAWVAFAACALARDDRWELLTAWLPGLARSANQGPYSQAHFVEAAAPLHEGGARKAPTEWPYITDWACLAVGGFVELVLLHLFGLDFGLDAIAAAPRLDAVDPDATLAPVRYDDWSYRATADGLSTA
ncbi:MAG: hypothetical protein GVY18_01995 [Bacteroidetes bacterium]|jgi:hypothetical protein|nr:hypothetical protein [Bacteroidota bacterium]